MFMFNVHVWLHVKATQHDCFHGCHVSLYSVCKRSSKIAYCRHSTIQTPLSRYLHICLPCVDSEFTVCRWQSALDMYYKSENLVFRFWAYYAHFLMRMHYLFFVWECATTSCSAKTCCYIRDLGFVLNIGDTTMLCFVFIFMAKS